MANKRPARKGWPESEPGSPKDAGQSAGEDQQGDAEGGFTRDSAVPHGPPHCCQVSRADRDQNAPNDLFESVAFGGIPILCASTAPQLKGSTMPPQVRQEVEAL